MKILIIGSCRNNDLESKPVSDRKIAEELGKALANKGHELITGGAGGLQGILVSSYKKSDGKKWTVVLAKDEEKDENAKPLEKTSPDEEIKTNLNYSIRDASYIENADGIIALSGKLLTFAEIILAVKNYKKKVFQLEMGKNLDLIRNAEELKEKVFISSSIKKGLTFLEGD